MTTKILIIDDEPAAAANLENKIKDLEISAQIRTAIDPVAALAMIEDWRPDILFLDIQMPTMDGFSLLNQIPEQKRRFALVFCTAYSEFAVKAFEESAIDYLLKPVEPERLNESLRRALGTKKAPPIPESLARHQFLTRIYAKNAGAPSLLRAPDIAYFSSESHETVVIANEHEYICDLSLDSLQEKLDPAMFFRCHRSKIVNLLYVESFNQKTSQLSLKGSKQRIPVAKRNRGAMAKKLKYMGSV